MPTCKYPGPEDQALISPHRGAPISNVVIWNLPARRLFGGVLGICDFRHKTPRQSQISLTPAMRDRQQRRWCIIDFPGGSFA